MASRTFLFFVLLLALIPLLLIPVNLRITSQAVSPQSLTPFIVSVSIVFLTVAGIKILSVEGSNKKKKGIYFEISKEIPEIYKSYLREIERYIKDQLGIEVYEIQVDETPSEKFGYQDLKAIKPYGLRIRFTDKEFSESLYRGLSYIPYGLVFEGAGGKKKTIISIGELRKYIKNSTDTEKVLRRLILHELGHVAGLKDSYKGIMDPYLRYDPTKEEINQLRKRLYKELYEV